MTAIVLPAWAELLPGTKVKLLVDLTNSLEAGADHLRVVARSSGPFQRFCEGLTGETRQRSKAIAGHHQAAIAGVFALINDLTRTLTTSSPEITAAAGRLVAVERAVAKTAHVTADVRDQLRALATDMDGQVGRIDGELAQMDLRISSRDHIESALSRWEAGGLKSLGIAARCYVCLADLEWGAFGHFVRQPSTSRQKRLHELTDRVVSRMQWDAGVRPGERVPVDVWLADTECCEVEPWCDARTFHGDGATPNVQPTLYVCSQMPPAAAWPATLPRICNAERLTRAMISEVFRLRQEEVYS